MGRESALEGIPEPPLWGGRRGRASGVQCSAHISILVWGVPKIRGVWNWGCPGAQVYPLVGGTPHRGVPGGGTRPPGGAQCGTGCLELWVPIAKGSRCPGGVPPIGGLPVPRGGFAS